MILEKHAIAKLCNAVQAALAEVASAVVRVGSWHFDAISIVWQASPLLENPHGKKYVKILRIDTVRKGYKSPS
jgi:hypothetical protein